MQPVGVLETVVYATDLEAVRPFYLDVLGLELIDDEAPHHLFFQCGQSLFLVFNPHESSQQNMEIDGTEIPRHGAEGPCHMAFRIQEADIDPWKQRLAAQKVVLEAEINWPQGGRSLYFRDPAGNSIELATPKLWGLKE